MWFCLIWFDVFCIRVNYVTNYNKKQLSSISFFDLKIVLFLFSVIKYCLSSINNHQWNQLCCNWLCYEMEIMMAFIFLSLSFSHSFACSIKSIKKEYNSSYLILAKLAGLESHAFLIVTLKIYAFLLVCHCSLKLSIFLCCTFIFFYKHHEFSAVVRIKRIKLF